MEFIGQDTARAVATTGARSPDGVVVAMLHTKVSARQRIATRLMKLRRRLKRSADPAIEGTGLRLYRPGPSVAEPDDELEDVAATER